MIGLKCSGVTYSNQSCMREARRHKIRQKISGQLHRSPGLPFCLCFNILQLKCFGGNSFLLLSQFVRFVN